jgi:hypothetical protein
MHTNTVVNSSATMSVAGSNALETSDDIDAMLASFAPKATSSAAEKNEDRKAPRFRVKWHADILVDERSIYHGFLNDISTVGASIYLNNNVHPIKPTLRIHVPPLSLTAKPHIIEVTGKTLYVVYDGGKQLYRASINFLSFRVESDLAYLDERLTRHHSKIPEH